ncbi:TraB/GumN family protein [Clostridium tertium]|uniref:TraB/GumN family protein n=1 Tax=Clostridium TaxID=1485 RepID=UPI00232CA5FD|nr:MULTISPECIES: TraB/GumN family protein [Clostridium]MDB1923924.1 TraB/GumN family protein [Clostridium tertium]MDB1926999.1 TraB/GumN family protein [Clostridium tertium]MDB1930675.1 TraB/GumN family protein [Clostridium tertium]MDU2158578.1 TraB/GumN family protein [Clostridium sp.]MDU7947883.1 TraB/GumN family protein [Clostridium sp.]
MKFIFKFKNLLFIFIIAFFTTTLVACNNKSIEKEVSKGYIWEATNGSTSVNLVGTIHLGSNNINFLNDDIKRIIDETDVLSVELDLSLKENIEKTQSSGYLKDGKTIENYLSEDEINKLSSIINTLSPKFNIKEINNLNSFSLSSLLTNLCYAKAGILGNGLDLIMINGVKLRKANGDNITINELEGVDYQLETINKTFTWEYLKKYLNYYSNSNIDEEVDIAKNLFNSYKTGDIEFIEESNNKMKNDSPEYYKIMLTDRNIGMTNKIDELIKDGKKHTVAVGAAHFIGEDGILKLLEEKGYKITRVN